MYILPEVAEHTVQNIVPDQEDHQIIAEADKGMQTEELMLREEHDLQQVIIITDLGLQITHILVHDHLL